MDELSITQPEQINIPLFLHQLKSIQDMEELEDKKEIELKNNMYISTKFGVLSDLPGYGKSLSILGLISRTLKKPIDEIYTLEKTQNYDYISMTKVELLEQVNTTLILVNVSLLSQWTHELSRTLLRYKEIYNKNDIEELDLKEYDVILVSNNVYNLFSQVYRKKSWKRFIIDEPASLKLYAMEPSYAQFYWLVTGTPHELYIKRRTGFLNDLLPEDSTLFSDVLLKNEDQFVKSSYEMPLTKHYYHKYSGNISKIFEGIVSENIIEMIQACNIGGVFNSFNVTEEDVNLTIFDAYVNRKVKRIQELKKDDKTDQIEKTEEFLNLINERIFRYVLENSCLNCGNSHKNPSVLTCCQNIYCGNCIIDLCPFCMSETLVKIPLNIKELQDTKEEHKFNQEKQNKSKIDTLLDIIDNVDEKKILIFSNYNDTFSIIKKFLDKKGLNYLELRGTKEKRDNTIDSYKSGNVNILLLNTIHSGAGLNLQETTDIILYHRIHEYQKIQVIGRANRIGRKKELNVHYLEY
jgi:SNF2 family DNA or RNA helicase